MLDRLVVGRGLFAVRCFLTDRLPLVDATDNFNRSAPEGTQSGA